MERYAASFRKLADSFYGLPYRKDYLSSGQVDDIIRETCDEICSHCYQREICWGTQSQEMYRGSERMIRSMEEGNQEKIQETKSDWMSVCSRFSQYYETLGNAYMRERQKLIWDNRMIESRLAVAQQLQEMSRIMDMVAEDLYDISIADPLLMTELQKILRKRHIVVKQVWVMDKVEGRREIFLTMRARSGQCISVNEVAQLLSREFGTPMAAAGGGRRIVNGEYHTVHFVEDVSYQVLYGVAKLTKEHGEGFRRQLYLPTGRGRAFCNVSFRWNGLRGGGMPGKRGSGRTSGTVSGIRFSQETAAKMVNSALVMKGQDGMFSTVDICAVDLYTGICNFLKAGASATFIKRDHWVEAISSESLAAGLIQQVDFETSSRKLYHGDYLIMMTDGVLGCAALPCGRRRP